MKLIPAGPQQLHPHLPADAELVTAAERPTVIHGGRVPRVLVECVSPAGVNVLRVQGCR